MSDETKIILALIAATFTATIASITAMFLGWWNSSQADRQQRLNRYSDRLAKQLQNVYGPLHFWSQHNKKLLERHGKIRGLFETIYIKTKWSEQESTQKAVHADSTITIEVMNKYIRQCVANNRRMIRVITQNYAYIHPDDAEMFQELVNDWDRWKFEDELPIRIRMEAEDVAFYRREFVDAIEKRVKEINDEFHKLSQPRTGWLRSRRQP